jgi:glycosyltransferase involved in cell wall biosynthesis
MRILILNWRDTFNPAGGGAEVYVREIAKRWVQKGHEVILFCSSFSGASPEQNVEGVKVVRQGNRFTVYWKAYQFYKRYSRGYFDCVLESVNTLPFFTPWYVQGKRFAFFHQLAREVWFYEASFPINILGYLLEPLYLKVYKKEQCIANSESTKNDLRNLGIHRNIPVFNPGITFSPLENLPQKETVPTLIYVGRLKRSKRVHHVLEAFAKIKQGIPQCQLWIVGGGDGSYEDKLKKFIGKNNIQNVVFLGFIDGAKKMELMRKAHIILVTSVREGWGIVVIEAAAMGVPAVVYNVHGLRDSVQNGQTGVVTQQNKPENLAREVIDLLKSPDRWNELAKSALERSKIFNWDEIANRFLKFIQET